MGEAKVVPKIVINPISFEWILEYRKPFPVGLWNKLDLPTLSVSRFGKINFHKFHIYTPALTNNDF